MSMLGVESIGVIPLATEPSSTLTVGPLDIVWEPMDVAFWVPGQMVIEDLIYDIEITRPAIIQTSTVTVTYVDFTIDPLPLSIHSLYHGLIVPNLDYQIEIPDVLVEQIHPGNVAPPDWYFDIPNVQIGQTQAPIVPTVEYRYEFSTPITTTQTHVLKIDSVNYSYSIGDIWMFLPQECVSHNSSRTIDGGLLIDRKPEGTPSTDRWYTEDRYRIIVKWDYVSRKTAFALDGFFRSYRYQETIYMWPGDKRFYLMSLVDDPEINQADSLDSWTASIEMVGSLLTPANPVLARLKLKRIGPDEARIYAKMTNTPILNVSMN